LPVLEIANAILGVRIVFGVGGGLAGFD